MAMQQRLSAQILSALCSHFQKTDGEGLDCPDYTDFLETTLKLLLQEYKPNDIYNDDEASLFYKALANRTYAFSAEILEA